MERPHVRTRIGRWAAALSSLAGVLLLLASAAAAPARAAPGDLDLTFSGDGKQTTDFGFGARSAAATVRQPDGKIVAVGRVSAGGSGGGDFALARYNADGSLDTSFSGDGKQRTDFGGNSDGATDVVLQADGNIVAVGFSVDDMGTGSFALARYNADGSLDTSFSGDGRQTTVFGSFGEGGATGVALQGDGKIVVVGGSNFNGSHTRDFALARYNPNGSLDSSFSGDGTQTTSFEIVAGANGVAIQANGKIVAVGTDFDGGAFALARYNADGSLDTNFSGDGKQTTDFGDFDSANGVAIQGDGKIVAVGFSGASDDFALARYNADGSLDTSFSGDGRQTTDFGGSDGASDVALQGAKVIAVGSTGAAASSDFALARYNADGSLDTSFSGDGKETTDFGGSDGASDVALQGAKVIAVGSTGAAASSDFALARYNADGSLDTNFSGDGKQTTGFAGFDAANGVAIQADGKIVAVGSAGAEGFALARYNADGSLDASFSGDGKQTTDFGDDSRARAVALQGDGKIVVVGFTGDFGGGDFALARYNPNGSLDSSFSGDGKQTTNVGGDFDSAGGVAVRGDGKIVVVGRAGACCGGADFGLARYNANGSLDTNFSGDGKERTPFSAGGDEANGVALQGSKIIAVGQSFSTTGAGVFALARYNTDGSLDPNFSGDGKQRTVFGAGATDVALRPDGKLVVVGGAGDQYDAPDDFALARYNANGSLDTSFSGDGKQTTDFGGSGGATGMALESGGKIIAVGAGGAGAGNFALARYNPTGSLDTSFSGDGRQMTNFGGSDRANGVVLQSGGRIVAVGIGLGTEFTNDFALARYLAG